MTRNELVQRVSDIIERNDISSLDTGETGEAPNLAERRGIIDAINGGYQEMRHYAPRDFFKVPASGLIREPESFDVDAAHQSTTIEIQSAFSSWMVGCTVIIAGDPRCNRLLSETELENPYINSSHPTSITTVADGGTIYSDSIKLDTGQVKVNEPVFADSRRLVPVPNEAVPIFRSDGWWNDSAWADYDYGFDGEFQIYNLGFTGAPTYYYVDTVMNLATGEQSSFLRFRSLPSDAAVVHFTVESNAPRWTADAFDTAQPEADLTVHVPADHIESVLLPLVRQNMTKYFNFEVLANQNTAQSENILSQIYQDYEEAIEILKDLKPQKARRTRLSVQW